MKKITKRNKTFIFLAIFLLVFTPVSYLAPISYAEELDDSGNETKVENEIENNNPVQQQTDIESDVDNNEENEPENTQIESEINDSGTNDENNVIKKPNSEPNENIINRESNSKSDEHPEKGIKPTNQLLQSEFREGDRHPDIIILKEKLIKLGFGGMNVNELYGSFTVTRIKQLQEYYGIKPVNGIANETTLNKIDEILSTPLQENSRHKNVIPLKEKLIALGYGGMNLNDLYGSFTATRVKQFQRDNGLIQNGIIDPVTNDKLNNFFPDTLKEGVRSPLVIGLKKKLVKLGFGGMNLNELYGSFTATRVKQLQEYYGIKPADGVANETTLNKIDEILSTPLQENGRHKSVVDLKKKLIALGYGGMNLNDLYGSFTATRVKQFQRDNGLTQNGIIDPVTKNKLNNFFPDTLKEGVRSPLVTDLKKKLIKLGFGGMNVNELYGSFTVTRVKQLQEYYGIKPVNGIADGTTLNRIDDILSTPLQENGRHESVIDLKKKLIALGYGGMNLNNLYGSFTATRVKQLQRDYGLIQNGIVDPVTMELLNSGINIYYEGNRHPLIIEFKEKLTHLGFGNMNINDLYGSFTTTRVKQFQRYYGLNETGTGTEETIQKLDELYNINLQEGKKHSDVISFKENLIKLGFGGMNVNETYDSFTAQQVREFQEHYGLIVNGIGDDRTIEKIDEILSSNFQEGKKHPDVIPLKKDLKEIGYGGMNINETYGSYTAKKVREFQKDHGLPQSGIADEITLARIAEVLKGINYTNYNLTLEEALKMQMKAKPQTDKREYAWVSKSYIDKNNRVTANSLNVRTQPSTIVSKENVILGTLSKGTKVDIIDELGNWYAINYSSTGYYWFHAVEEDVRYYLNPKNFVNDPRLKFQFLDLSKPSGAPRLVLDNYLKDKGVLKNQGQAFIDAARLHGVNDIYLLSHALLETGNGTSTLAKGVRVGLNAKGEPKRVTDSNEKSLTKIKKVYNVYGIGAVDSNPLNGGSIRAYTEGWDTVAKAIIGGAAFIGGDYIKAGQNTLYKMRWNPSAMANLGYASHQYATDVGWATKQVSNMYNLYREIGYDTPILDIPVYK